MLDLWDNIVDFWDNIKDRVKLVIAVILYVFLALFIAVIVGYVVWLFSLHSWLWSLLAFVIVGIPLIIWFMVRSALWKRLRQENKEYRILQEALKSEIDDYIQIALLNMDTTSKWYTDENEANRELVTSLKSQGLEAIYQPRLSNGSTADARVGNILIEGKLSPHKSDIDRLLGQLTEYTKFTDKVVVVIFGRLDKYAKERIENEISQRYLHRVSLSYLAYPNRNRHR